MEDWFLGKSHQSTSNLLVCRLWGTGIFLLPSLVMASDLEQKQCSISRDHSPESYRTINERRNEEVGAGMCDDEMMDDSILKGLSAFPDVPDSGFQAWLNCCGCSAAFFASFGIVNSFGVFQDYYKADRLSLQNDSVIALIGAIQLFCLYGLSPVIGKIFDAFGTLVCRQLLRQIQSIELLLDFIPAWELLHCVFAHDGLFSAA